MIDMHSHILFGIDDGCSSIEDSIKTISNMKKLGFNGVVLTPHYIEGSSFCAINKEKKERLLKLKEELEKNDIKMDLYLGNEVFINDKITELVTDKKIRTINNTRYILFELPFNSPINNIEDYIYELKINGFIPVLAHPERYTYFQNDMELVKKIYESGVYFQSNYGSALGMYGSEAKKLITYLLEHDMVSFLSSDVHRPGSSFFDRFNEMKNKIIEIVGNEKFKELSNDNILKVINDEDIVHNEILSTNKTIWDLFKRN